MKVLVSYAEITEYQWKKKLKNLALKLLQG